MQDKIKILKDVADEVDGKFCDDYSGRWMFGKTCVGIICDNAYSCIEAAAAQGIRGARTDNMGRSYIVYWPSIKSDNDTVI